MSDYKTKDVCPSCGCDKMIIGELENVSHTRNNKSILFTTTKSANIGYIACFNCRTIIRTFVKKPEELVLRKKHR